MGKIAFFIFVFSLIPFMALLFLFLLRKLRNKWREEETEHQREMKAEALKELQETFNITAEQEINQNAKRYTEARFTERPS